MGSLRRERVLASPRFRNGTFHNTPNDPIALTRGSVAGTTAEFFFGASKRRPKVPFPIEDPRETWRRASSSGLRATWLGHSTTLLEIDGHRVLTDPVWSERISPVSFAGPRRFHAAPVAIDGLPALDAIVISHDHFDHLDLPSVRELAKIDGVPFITSLGVGARLESVGIPPHRIVELDWWEETSVRGLTFTATPARHFSGRSLFDRNRTLWSSWAVESDRHGVFFSGDTGLTSDFSVIRERKGPFDLVMLEVGAFHPAWGDIHLGPDNALTAHQMLGGGAFLPVHWGTFDLALHAWDEPIESLVAHAGSAHVITPRLGRAIEPVQVERIDPWWRIGEPVADDHSITARTIESSFGKSLSR